MGGVSVGGGGHGGKKSVDSEIPLVPFIDLLLCCVMFLLVTAVWNQLARMQVNQQVPGQAPPTEETPPPEERIDFFVEVTQTGYAVGDSVGTRSSISKAGGTYDTTGLRTKLGELKNGLANDRNDIHVLAEDGVRFEDIIDAMDVAVGSGFTKVSLEDANSSRFPR